MKTLKITRFAGDPFAWNDYEIKNIKRDGSGKLIQVEVYAILWTMGSSIDTIYEIDADGNEKVTGYFSCCEEKKDYLCGDF